MNRTIILLSIAIIITYASDDLSEFIQSRNRAINTIQEQNTEGIAQQKQALQNYTYHSRKQFNSWHFSQKKALQQFKERITQAWGAYIEPTNKVWVEYSKDHTSLASVDFEKGKATVSVLVDAHTSKNEITEKVASVLYRAITSKGSNEYKPVEADTDNQRFSSPLLEKQVADSKGDDITVIGVSNFAQGLVEQGTITTKNDKIKVELKFNLAPDHLQKRIERVLPFIDKYCKKYNIDRARVLATIHTESHFNPMAVSSANAIGLMQLVPIYGGREAFSLVHGIDEIPKEELLYDPEKNIELGCVYIHLLKTRYFSALTNKKAQQYCTIAAYNTGPKNVAWAFTGERSLQKALPEINKMAAPQKIYEFLVEELPYAETRHYLAEVTKRMDLYK